MRVNGFVELTNDMDPEVLRSLVVGAYRMSSQGQVVLALSDVSERVVDRYLDPIVRDDGCHACGVWYLQGRPVSNNLVERAVDASFVIVTSPELARALDARGVRHMAVTEGVAYLTYGVDSARIESPSRRPIATT